MPDTAPLHAARRPNLIMAALTAAALSVALQQTLVVPALPSLTRDLGTTTQWGTWILTGFLLSSSVLTPLLGKLGDQFGKERLLVVSLSIFLVATIGAAFAWDIASLVGFRVLQGAGGGIFPLAFAIIRDEFPRERAPVAIGLVSAALGVGGGIAIVTSGLIVDNMSWRWLFVLGAAGIAVALAMVIRFVPESPIKSPSRVDWRGALLLSGGLVSLLVALTEGGSWGWTSGRTLGLFVVSAVLFAAFALVELRIDEPMVDMHVFVRRSVLFTNITGFVAGFAMFGSFVLVPAFVQTPAGLPEEVARLVDYGFGASATRAGFYLLPGSLAMLFAGPAAGLVGRRLGFRWPLSFGLAIVAVAAATLAAYHDHPWQIVVAMTLLSIGIGFSFATMPTLISEAVSQRETGVATGINTVMRSVGGVVGGQIGAALVASSTIAGTGVPSVDGYTAAWGIAAVAALLGAGAALLAGPARGRATAPVAATAES